MSAAVLILAALLVLVPLATSAAPAAAQGDDPLPLTQTIVTEDGRYAADYPAAPWFAVEDIPNGITVTNDETVYTEGVFPPGAGQAALIVLFPETVGDLGWVPEDTLDDVRANFPDDPFETIFIEGRETVAVDLSDADTDFVFYYFRLPGAGLTIAAYATGTGQFDDYSATMTAIIGSMRTTANTPTANVPADEDALPVFRDAIAPVATANTVDFEALPQLAQTSQSDNGNVSVRYPVGYSSFDDGNLVILPPGNTTSGEIPSGQLALYGISPLIDPEAAAFALADSGVGMAMQQTLYFRLVRPGVTPRNFSTNETFVIGDRAYDMFTFTSAFGDIVMIGFEFADGSPGLLYALSAPNEMQEQLPTVIAIADSMRLTE